MTTVQILKRLRKAGKPIAIAHLYNLFKKLGIAPVAARQRPQQYPADSAERILQHFGIFTARGANPRTDATSRHAVKLISVRDLREAKNKKNTNL